MRVTRKYLMNELNKIFERFEIGYKAIDMHHTRLLSRDYEGGAAVYIITIGDENGNPLKHPAYVYVFMTISEIQHLLNNGYRLKYELREGKYINESELTVTKI